MAAKPLALGVLDAGNSTIPGRRQARLRVAAFAYAEGYTLLETFELGINGLKDDVAAGGLISLTQRHHVAAVLVSKSVDVERLRQLDLPDDLAFLTLDA